MSRPVPAAIAVLCLLAGTIGAAAVPAPAFAPALSSASDDDRPLLGSQSGAAEQIEEIGVLSPDEPARSSLASQSIDVGSTVATQRVAARAGLDRRAFVASFERLEDEQDQREFLLQAATDVEIAISELRSEQRDLRESYASEEISTATFLRRRTVIDARAEQLRGDLDLIQEHVDRVPRLSMRSRLQSLRGSLTGFDGPVTARTRAAMTGETTPVRLYVATSTNGTALAMIAGDEYVRESFRADFWVPDSSQSLSLDDVELLAGDLYPVAINSSQTRGYGFDTVDTGLYQINIRHDQGEIEAYLDGDSQGVFYEVQRRPLNRIHPGPAVTMVENGTRLTVNRTFEGGPLRVSVADNATGEPVSTDVLVGDVRLESGFDGVVWTLMPADTTRVIAMTDAGNVSVQARPTGSAPGNETLPRPMVQRIGGPTLK